MTQSGGIVICDLPIFGKILSSPAKKEQIQLEIQGNIFWIRKQKNLVKNIKQLKVQEPL